MSCPICNDTGYTESVTQGISSIVLCPFLPHPVKGNFQSRCRPWAEYCFGRKKVNSYAERNYRFLEEALELVQSCGMPREQVYALVDYVFERPAGNPLQEIGGVLTTLATLCTAHGFDMAEAGELELKRIWNRADEIREKNLSKPRFEGSTNG